ncbi:hypothetical protein PAHAL_2G457400 [Panicum hallii]|uniref:Uncharacterized protein n=1 Tax=Panicum hallii TaxID=206008 RepID=A0A2T8KSY9_9POAL|nr:hypothetical protein PAHAL_2G457400 [Panicum hallii]
MQDVQRAAWNVMIIFYEIRRLRSWLVEVNHSIQHNLPPHPLITAHNSLIRNWG